MSKKLQQKNHLPLFDLLRYFCAVSVLIWHYQNFFLLDPDQKVPNYKSEDQPFWNLLSIPYSAGFNAVPIFWILSGVVLSKSYLTLDTKLKIFFVNRFARLYPLHVATLLLVLSIQFFSNALVGHPQVYKDNSLNKFLGNLLLLNDGSSFNAPTWSITVEIFSYIVFSLLMILRIYRPLFCLCIILASFLVFQTELPQSAFLKSDQIGNCGIYFFCGVFLIYLAERLPRYALMLLAISVTLFGLYNRNGTYFTLIIGIVMTFLVLESLLSFTKRVQRFLQTLGNLTYAIYLIHVPSQIILLIFIQRLGINQPAIVSNEIFFIFWFISLHIFSIHIYKRFEIPSKLWVRKKFKI